MVKLGGAKVKPAEHTRYLSLCLDRKMTGSIGLQRWEAVWMGHGTPVEPEC